MKNKSGFQFHLAPWQVSWSASQRPRTLLLGDGENPPPVFNGFGELSLYLLKWKAEPFYSRKQTQAPLKGLLFHHLGVFPPITSSNIGLDSCFNKSQRPRGGLLLLNQADWLRIAGIGRGSLWVWADAQRSSGPHKLRQG